MINWPKHLISTCLIFALFACNNADNLSSLKKQSVIYCSDGSPENFNPQTFSSSTSINAVSNQVYNRLITINPEDNSLLPSLAKSWHITKDGKRITFYLNKNVSFHHTDYFTPSRLMNADDVIFSFERIIDLEHQYHDVSAGKYPYFERIHFSHNILSLEKINDYTVRFSLHSPDASFLAHLASPYSVILSKEYADLLAIYKQHSNIDFLPIGTGPFKFKEYRVGSMIRYYRHDDYWQNSVAIEQLVYDITTNNTSRLTKLLTNECDIIAAPIAHQQLDEHPQLSLESNVALDIAFLAFNNNKPPFNNVLLRQAISHAINKQAIIKTVYFDQAIAAKTILPPSSWAAHDDVPSHDYSTTLALKLMSEAGFQDGLTMDLWAPSEKNAYNPDALTMALLIKNDLAQIGITVNIIHDEMSIYLEQQKLGNYDSVLLGWSADYPDPNNFLSTLLSCEATTIGNNHALWCNQNFDTLLQQAIQTDKINQRKLYYQKALTILDEKMPIVPIAHSKTYHAKNNTVHGHFFNSYGVNFNQVSKY